MCFLNLTHQHVTLYENALDVQNQPTSKLFIQQFDKTGASEKEIFERE